MRAWSIFLASCCLFLAPDFVASSAAQQQPQAAAPDCTPQLRQQDLADVTSIARRSVVKIRITGTSASGANRGIEEGSGFVVLSGPNSRVTYVATAAHLLKEAAEWRRDPQGNPERLVTILIPGGDQALIEIKSPVKVVAENHSADVALLAFDGGTIPAMTLGTLENDLAVGQQALVIGYAQNAAVATTSSRTREETEVGRYGAALRLDKESIPGQSGGPVIGMTGRVVGIVSENRGGYHLASLSSRLNGLLKEAGVDKLHGQEVRFRNGVYTGAWWEGTPDGQGCFAFEPGRAEIDAKDKVWRLAGRFRRGVPDGWMTLDGPLGNDQRPQECRLRFATGQATEGQCSVYFDAFMLEMGEDPRDRRMREMGLRRHRDDEKSARHLLIGRYVGNIVGGPKSIFEETDSMLPRLGEEYLLPQGQGEFQVFSGTPMLSAMAQDVGKGPMILLGQWVNGSFTGSGSVLMPNGSKIEGTFHHGYITSGHAIRATGKVFGLGVSFFADVYTGGLQAGLKHGKGELRNATLDYMFEGDFRWDRFWTGVWIGLIDEKKTRIEFREGN